MVTPLNVLATLKTGRMEAQQTVAARLLYYEQKRPAESLVGLQCEIRPSFTWEKKLKNNQGSTRVV